MTLRADNVQNVYIVKEKSLEHRSVALDLYSYAVSNIIVGNDETSAAIEIVDGFFEGTATEDCFLSVTGLASVAVEGSKDKGLWRCIFLKKGSKIKVSTISGGVAYIAISGGIRVSVESGRLKIPPNEILESSEPVVPYEDLVLELPARHLPENYIPKRSRSIEVVPLADEIPSNCLLAERNPHRGFILTPRERVNELLLNAISSDPPPGAVTIDKNSLRVLSSSSEESLPIVGALPAHSLDALSRLALGSSLKLRKVRPVEAMRRELSYLNLIRRIRRIIELAVEALRRGAVLVRIRYGGRIYEAWVEELA